MNDLPKKRFDLLAGKIAEELQSYKDAEKQLMGAAIALRSLLDAYIFAYERTHGQTAETKALRIELDASWNIIVDPSVLPALEAAHMHFDDITIDLARLVGSLPSSSP